MPQNVARNLRRMPKVKITRKIQDIVIDSKGREGYNNSRRLTHRKEDHILC